MAPATVCASTDNEAIEGGDTRSVPDAVKPRYRAVTVTICADETADLTAAANEILVAPGGINTVAGIVRIPAGDEIRLTDSPEAGAGMLSVMDPTELPVPLMSAGEKLKDAIYGLTRDS